MYKLARIELNGDNLHLEHFFFLLKLFTSVYEKLKFRITYPSKFVWFKRNNPLLTNGTAMARLVFWGSTKPSYSNDGTSAWVTYVGLNVNKAYRHLTERNTLYKTAQREATRERLGYRGGKW